MYRIAKHDQIEQEDDYQHYKKRQQKELNKLMELNENATKGLKKDLQSNLITEIFENTEFEQEKTNVNYDDLTVG